MNDPHDLQADAGIDLHDWPADAQIRVQQRHRRHRQRFISCQQRHDDPLEAEATGDTEHKPLMDSQCQVCPGQARQHAACPHRQDNRAPRVDPTIARKSHVGPDHADFVAERCALNNQPDDDHGGEDKDYRAGNSRAIDDTRQGGCGERCRRRKSRVCWPQSIQDHVIEQRSNRVEHEG